MTPLNTTNSHNANLPTPIAILGAGRVGSTLGHKLASQGCKVIFGLRDPEVAAAKWTGPEVTFTDLAGAADAGQLIINATPGDSTLARLSALRSELADKILVDVANATIRAEGQPLGELCYPGSSLAEKLQEALPATKVVKTLNTVMFTVMGDPQSLSTPPTAFLSGNDQAAKANVCALLGDLGWPSEWILDLGDLTTARGTEALFMFVPYIVSSQGFVPFALSVAL